MPASHKNKERALTRSVPGFGSIKSDRVLSEDELFIVISDKYPVSPGHSLIVAKRAVSRFRELTFDERTQLTFWIEWSISHLEANLQPKPDGFNIGLNDGPAAGQTVGQLHVHIIPRYEGDVLDPRGGVRLVIPHKANYWD